MNAAWVAAWLASSPETIARNRSDDRISSGAKWRAAKVDLPAPAAPIEDDQAGIGDVDLGSRCWTTQLAVSAVRRTS